MNALKRALRQFRDDESGLIMAEFIITLPMLIWVFMAFFAYWDVFRSMNTAQKAAYTVSDLISRQNNDIPETFLDGMKSVMEYIMPAALSADMRFTSVKFNAVSNKFEVIWSRTRGSMTPFNNVSLQGVANQIPLMAATDTVVIVETSVPYAAPFSIGLANNYKMEEFIVTRPRFLNKICIQGAPCT